MEKLQQLRAQMLELAGACACEACERIRRGKVEGLHIGLVVLALTCPCRVCVAARDTAARGIAGALARSRAAAGKDS